MSEYTLYGDGVHDDTAAIQEMIDSGVCEVCLPAPKAFYLISKTLVIPSNFKLKLPRFAEVRLANNANCLMLMSKTVEKPACRMADYLNEEQRTSWYFVDAYSNEPEDACVNFEIEGGIWNFNNMKMKANPFQTHDYAGEHLPYIGTPMLFYNARNFRLSNMTLKDPTNYCIMLDTASYFTFENIDFDFNTGNPYAVNMDGIHLNGNCFHGFIRNLEGACYDDLVALNAHEGSGGDIANILIDGIYAENCHSAVRLLTVHHKVRNIRISNVFGTYYQYCIGFTKYYPGETDGYFDAIVLDNISAAKSKRQPVQEMHLDDKSYVFPFIWLQEETAYKTLTINGVHRREYAENIDTIHIGKEVIAEHLVIHDVTLENHTGKPCEKFVNHGTIQELCTDLSSDEITDHGNIQSILR